MDLTTLAVLLADPKYAAMTDAEAAAELNRPHLPGPIGTVEVRKKMARQGTFAVVVVASKDTDPAQSALRLTCIDTLEIIRDNDNDLDVSDPDVQAVLVILVTALILTQAQSDELTALSDNQQSEAGAAGLGRIRTFQVSAARAL
mgnify:CR=1 FL=1